MKGGLRVLMLLLSVALIAAVAVPMAVAKPKTFQGSDDSGKVDEPEKYLPDYDKLVEGSDVDWVYFPAGGLKSAKSVSVKTFKSNAIEENKEQADAAAKAGKRYLDQWLKKAGFNVVEDGGEVVFEGNVFDAYEAEGAARHWGWGAVVANRVGIEIIAKDSGGKIVAEIRHKNNGSTVKDATENCLEEITKAIAKGK